MVEKILKLGVKKGLWTDTYQHSWSITYCGVVSHFTKDNYKDGYIVLTINIDGVDISCFTYIGYKRGCLHYLHYISDEFFDNGYRKKYDIYVPIDDVLDGKPFYTTNKIERRKLKIEKLIKIKNERLQNTISI
jgi:hypothetical protein